MNGTSPHLPLAAAALPAEAAQAHLAGTGTAPWWRRAGRGSQALRVSAALWFGVAVLGQLMFSAYVVVFFGRSALQGRFQDWSQVLPRGHVPGDAVGNAVLALHLLFTTVVVAGGALQLLTVVRQRWPRFHHWNGRVYLLAAVVLSLGGLFMVWARGSIGGLWQHIGISVNALLIIGFAALALRHALARQLAEHRRWALRLFLAVGGVWFFRIGLMLWIVVNQGPVGFNPKTFEGPFLVALQFGQFLLPLAVLELYFWAQRCQRDGPRLAVAGVLGVLTLMTAAGITAAALIMWIPRM